MFWLHSFPHPRVGQTPDHPFLRAWLAWQWSCRPLRLASNNQKAWRCPSTAEQCRLVTRECPGSAANRLKPCRRTQGLSADLRRFDTPVKFANCRKLRLRDSPKTSSGNPGTSLTSFVCLVRSKSWPAPDLPGCRQESRSYPPARVHKLRGPPLSANECAS